MTLTISEERVANSQQPAAKAHQVDERFVWWLWQTRRFDGAAARALGFDVIFPGWFSTSAGPDFRDALIADAHGRLQRGDVEIHVDEASWNDHGHATDPAYKVPRVGPSEGSLRSYLVPT
jgi:Protein of unknown function (DUF2851)